MGPEWTVLYRAGVQSQAISAEGLAALAGGERIGVELALGTKHLLTPAVTTNRKNFPAALLNPFGMTDGG
jgi:hypothetical protein